MPTDGDKKSARIRFDGEAKRVRIRRPRFHRDGFYLFGRRYAGQTVTLSAAELTALFDRRTLAVDVSGEYILYLAVDPPVVDAAGMIAAMAAPRGPGRQESRIPEREDPSAVPTHEARVLAARIRVKIDRQARRPRVKTPEWIVRLAEERTA